MPGYFADRYAFGLLRSPRDIGRVAVPRLTEADVAARSETLRRACVPVRSLSGWRADADEATRLSPFYGEIRDQWREFSREIGLPRGVADLSDARAETWREVFDRSVFYPRPPAITGPSYFERLSVTERELIRARFGTRSPIDFFCLMQQVHETVHLHQTGEPLLNEVVQAGLWIAFLERSGLTSFQRTSTTGGWLVREAAVVRDHPWIVPTAVDANLDTARLIDHIGTGATYFACCAWAHRFDRGDFRYSDYLDGLNAILSRRGSKWSGAQIRRLLRSPASSAINLQRA